MIFAIVIGIVLSLIGTIFSYFTSIRSLKKKDWDEFISSYFITQSIKFIFLISILIILIIAFNIDKIPFLISFFLGYIFFLTFEIIYLNKSKSFSNFGTKNKHKAK